MSYQPDVWSVLYIKYLASLSMQSLLTASMAYFLPVMLLLITIFIIRMDCRVSCWFCNYYTSVPRSQSNSWYCPSCEQYNGFNKYGDYNKSIPSQRRADFNCPLNFSNKSTNFIAESDILCSTCTQRQKIKMQLLNQFDLVDDNNWECAYRDYQSKMERRYALCSLCEALAQQRVRQCDSLVLPKYVEWTKLQAQKAFFRKFSLYKYNWRRNLFHGISLMTLYTNLGGSSLFILVNSRHTTSLTNFLKNYFYYMDANSMLLMCLLSSLLHLILNLTLKCLNRCVLLNLVLTILYLTVHQLKVQVHIVPLILFQILHVACAVLALSFKLPNLCIKQARAPVASEAGAPYENTGCTTSRPPFPPTTSPQRDDQQLDSINGDVFSDTDSIFSTNRISNPFYLQNNNDNLGYAPSMSSRRHHSGGGGPATTASQHSIFAAPRFTYNRPASVASFPRNSGGPTRSNSINGECSTNGLPRASFNYNLDIPSPPPSRCSSPPLSTLNESVYSRRSHVSPHQCQLLNQSLKSECCTEADLAEEAKDNLDESRQSSTPSLLMRCICGVLLGIGFTCVMQFAVLPGMEQARLYFIKVLPTLGRNVR